MHCTQTFASHCGVGLGSMTLGKGEALFIQFTIPKVQKNSPIYGVTMGLWLIASGMSPVTPGQGGGAQKNHFGSFPKHYGAL